MLSSSGTKAVATNYLEVVELSKSLGHSFFRDVEALAFSAPGLKVVRVGAVLDEAKDAASCLQVMTTDDRTKLFRMSSASGYRPGVHGFSATMEWSASSVMPNVRAKLPAEAGTVSPD